MMTDCASSHCSNHEDGDDRVAAQPVSAGRVWSRALIIFVFALFLRLAYLYQVWGVPFMHFPSVDARRYDEWGQAIARGDWWGNEVIYQAPLYPYLVGAVYAVFGRSLPALHVIQMLIGAGTCALAYLAGRRYFGERAGLLSGALLTIYSPAIFFDGIMHKEGLALFLLMLVVYLLGRTLDGADRRTFIVAGLATGLLALTRENLLILALVVPLWVLARRDLGLLKRRAASAAMFLCGVAMLLLPVALRNYAVGSTFAVTSYNVGQNFFLGNNPDATGVYEPLIHSRQDPQYEREDAERLAERALGRDLTAGEVSSYWFRRGVQYAIDQPADWLKLTARKSLLTWNRFEVPDTEDPGLYAEHSVILRWLSRFVHFGVLAPLGVAGMVLAWRRRGRVAVLYILVLAATASAAIFFVFARYRYPLVAPLVLFAGFAVVQMATLLRDRRAARLLAAIAFAAVVALVVNRPMLAEGAYRSVAYVNLAGMHEKLGEGEKADAALQRALELYADNALAHFHLGRLLVKRGAAESAERHLLRAVAIDPELYVGYAALSDLYEGQGRATEAASQLRTAVTLAPDEAELHLRLGGVLLRLGAREEAAHEFAVAIDLTPGLEERLSKQERAITEQARQESADLLGRARRARSAGDYLLAIQLYEEATAIYPQDASLHYELASALAAVNDEPRAITFFERALELDPDLTAAHNDLGQLLTGMGAFDKAIEHYRAAIRVEPDMIPSHYNLATTLAAAGRIEEALAAMEQCLEVARRRGSADVVARVEDRLARLREDQSRRQSPIEP